MKENRRKEDIEMFIKIVYQAFMECHVPKAVALNTVFTVALHQLRHYTNKSLYTF